MKSNSGGGGGGGGGCGGASLKPDRKTIERNRRIHMKTLCFKLASLIPPQYHRHHLKRSPNSNPKDVVSQQEQLDEAAEYIKYLRGRIEKLKEKAVMMKSTAEAEAAETASCCNSSVMNGDSGAVGLPVVELKDWGSSIEVILISGLNKNFMLYEVISILHQEGAEVVSASFCTVGAKIFHTLHAQVKISRVGVDTARVCQRLQELISFY